MAQLNAKWVDEDLDASWTCLGIRADLVRLAVAQVNHDAGGTCHTLCCTMCRKKTTVSSFTVARTWRSDSWSHRSALRLQKSLRVYKIRDRCRSLTKLVVSLRLQDRSTNKFATSGPSARGKQLDRCNVPLPNSFVQKMFRCGNLLVLGVVSQRSHETVRRDGGHFCSRNFFF
jgi:hypothetical protein